MNTKKAITEIEKIILALKEEAKKNNIEYSEKVDQMDTDSSTTYTEQDVTLLESIEVRNEGELADHLRKVINQYKTK